MKGISRILVAASLAVGLVSIFQNCSKMNFSADSQKSLVEGVAPSGDSASTTTSGVSATPPPDVGICVLTCVGYTNDEHEFSQDDTGSCKVPKLGTCIPAEDGTGTPIKSVIQTLAGDDSHPKTVCISHSACAMIGQKLASGKTVLMRVSNNQVSTSNATKFEPAASADDCQDTLSDSEVAQQF